jgi:drug/metabolite transporter (DMT)-like permease
VAFDVEFDPMGGASLSLFQVLILVAYAVAMAVGQVLFKLAAVRIGAAKSVVERLSALAHNGYFVAAVLLYAALTGVWLWILTFTPLSRAYVFVALSFVVTPFAAAAIFGEPITARLVLGLGLIVAGLWCVAG